MAGTSAEAQVAKKCYKNQTAGWLGVVKVDHLGAQQGAPVEPFGTVYLSDEEAILTARAPANPKDNPFEEQTFMFADEQGQHTEQKMRPLILLSDDEQDGGDGERYVPVGDINPHTVAAQVARTEAALDAQDEQPRTVATSVEEPTQVGSPVAAVDPAHSRPAPVEEPEDEEKGESWVENEDRTLEPQRGNLGGSNDHPGTDDADPAAGEGQRQQAPPPQAPVQQTVGAQQSPGPVPSESAGTGEAAGAPSEQAAVEETAAAEGDSSLSVEETGAAVDPKGQAPEGEFAAHEEVGSPDAPAAEKGDAA